MTEHVTFGPPIEVPVDEDEDCGTRRLRVYRAENKAAANAPAVLLDGSRAAAQAYVNRVVRSAWWRRTCTPIDGRWHVAKVEVVQARRNAGGAAMYGFHWLSATRARGAIMTIRLGGGHVNASPAIGDPWVILHELAHVLAIRDGHRGHGREFARYYLLAVQRWMGDDAARALRAAYVEEGVKYRATSRRKR